MKKDILIKGVIMPLLIGILLAVAFFLFANGSKLCPVDQGTVVAYHDEQLNTKKVGTLFFDRFSLDLYEKASYSSLVNGASIEQGNGIGKAGVCYIKVFQNNTKTLMERDITINTDDAEYCYTYAGKLEAKSEYNLLLNKPSLKRGIILYYQKSNGLGFSNDYEALIYKEVQ